MDNHVEDHPKNLTIRFPSTASIFSLIIDPESHISGYENVFYKSERIQKSIIKTIWINKKVSKSTEGWYRSLEIVVGVGSTYNIVFVDRILYFDCSSWLPNFLKGLHI